MEQPKSESDVHALQMVREVWNDVAPSAKLGDYAYLSGCLEHCETPAGQLEVLVYDMQQRRDVGVAVDVSNYLERANLVSDDAETRLRLLEKELADRLAANDAEGANELCSLYPELLVTKIPDETDRVLTESFQTVHVSPTNEAPPDSTPAEASSSTLRFGRYQVERQIGQGGCGAVYLATDTELGRTVAIKTLIADRLGGQNPEDFHREAKATASLNHPNIVTLYDVSKSEDGATYVVMEYVDGDTLAGTIRRHGFQLREGIEILIHTCSALAFAHRKGFVHRDLKPLNVLIDSDGRPKVADFGLAVHEDAQRMRVGEVAGTLYYMSPEQVRGETHRLDGRTDIWSVGVILYELLTGRLPFAGSTADQLCDEILNRRPKPPRQVNPAALKSLEKICLRCLSPDIESRYGNANDLARDLEKTLPALAPEEQDTVQHKVANMLIGVLVMAGGALASFIGGFFFIYMWIVGFNYAFVSSTNTQECISAHLVIIAFGWPLFLGIPAVILGLWLIFERGFQWRGFGRRTSGRAVASFVLASITPVTHVFSAIPAVWLAFLAIRDVNKKSPIIQGRWLAVSSILLTILGTAFSTWMLARSVRTYMAFEDAERAAKAFEEERYERAILEADLAISRFSMMPYGWNIKGAAFQKSAQPQRAIAALNESLSILKMMIQKQPGMTDPTENPINYKTLVMLTDAYHHRSEAYRALGRNELAEADASLSIEFRAKADKALAKQPKF